MAFPRVRPAGWVGDVDPITDAELNQLDINVSQSVDGIGGGSYTLTAPLIFIGSGVRLGGANNQVQAGGTLTVLSGGFLTYAVGSVTAFNGTVSTGTGVWTWSSDVNVQSGSGWVFAAGSAITISVGADLVVNGEFSSQNISDSTAFGLVIGDAIHSGILGFSSTGHIRKRFVTGNGAADTNYSINDGDIFYGSSTANGRIWNFTSTGAAVGDTILVHNNTGAFTLLVKDDVSGDTLASLQAGVITSVIILWNGTRWWASMKSNG